MNTFEDLRAYRRAVDLTVDVYEATASFPPRELYGLTSQLRRAAVSVVSHIAEGQGRLTHGEWRRMLSQARGSLYEVQAQVMLSHRLGLLGTASAEHLQGRVRAAARELAGLIRWVRQREEPLKRRAQTGDQRMTRNTNPISKD